MPPEAEKQPFFMEKHGDVRDDPFYWYFVF